MGGVFVVRVRHSFVYYCDCWQCLIKRKCNGILSLQCATKNRHAVSSSVRDFHRSMLLTATADHPQQKDQVFTLCSQSNGIRTITLNYAKKRYILYYILLLDNSKLILCPWVCQYQGLKWGRVRDPALFDLPKAGRKSLSSMFTSDCGRDLASFLDHFKHWPVP